MTRASLLADVQFRKTTAIAVFVMFSVVFIITSYYAFRTLEIAIASPPVDVGPHFDKVLVGVAVFFVTEVVGAVVLLFKEVFGPHADVIDEDSKNKIGELIASLVIEGYLSEDIAQQVMEQEGLPPLSQVITP